MARTCLIGPQFVPQRSNDEKRADGFSKKRVFPHKMLFRCVEMSLFSSGKLSSFCLFSYTFRLPTSFTNIFFFSTRSRRDFSPSAATMEPRLRRMICPLFSASVWAFVLSSGRPGEGVAFRPPPSPQAKHEPRCLVNRILSCFPTGRKQFYKLTSLFPTGRKA